ncbi:hypothetical protein HDR61_03480 [bacterium]|nr:hypothetical protein [bacterium]
MKLNRNVLSRGVIFCAVPLMMLLCGRSRGAGAATNRVQTQIDSIENLRGQAMARVDSCVARANAALDAHELRADKMDAEYVRFIDSKYMMSKYFSPAQLDMIRDVADNWLPDSARDTDVYKKIAIDCGTLADMQTLFADFVAGGDIDVCRKELMGILVFYELPGGGYSVGFYDKEINTQAQRQRADYMNLSAYRDSRRVLSAEVRAIADSTAAIRAQVAHYDEQLQKLHIRMQRMRRQR